MHVLHYASDFIGTQFNDTVNIPTKLENPPPRPVFAFRVNHDWTTPSVYVLRRLRSLIGWSPSIHQPI